MLIKNLFEKPIDRGIRGVIKVEQNDETLIKQELEEYVVTRELSKNFDRFFSFYKKGLSGNVDIPAVWISGFFGSGKSHFLKILSYLLSGEKIAGKRAVDYFVDDNKIEDTMVLANMKAASNTSSDVILFNIDSKSTATAKKDKEAILSVFLRVFNEQLGYCGANPFIADLERKLDDQNKFDKFKAKFNEITSSDWDQSRHEFGFIQDDIVDTLVQIGFMSEVAARNWCENAMGDYKLSIADFAKMVKKYIDSKGNNHRVIFMIDEVGQYIGDDRDLMLNLQTIVESLSNTCKDRAWVICTGQQDIDSITKVIGNDLSKILGRFERISLSSADVDEVIKRRILAKTETAMPSLEMLYDQKASIIKNAVVFSDSAEMKLYSGREEFSACYPFIPYQFNLLGRSLNAIREHSSSGKHMSEGERSMLAVTQESAISVMNQNEGIFVPFSSFYAPIEKFIDSSHSAVISRAKSNSKLEEMDVNILKVLFMIKYVKEIVATVDNITTLMLTSIDEDRLELRKQVEEGLQRLIKQTLVQKQLNNGKDVFVFLTNEEQEIAREINNTNVENSELIAKLSDILFNDIYINTKYSYDTKHSYPFNKIFDDRFFGGVQNCDIGVKIISPLNGGLDDSVYRMTSQQEKNVIVVLPELCPYYEEIRTAMQIEKYLSKNSVSSVSSISEIKKGKQKEASDRKAKAKMFLADAVREAKIFVNGDLLVGGAKDAAAKIDEAIKKLFLVVFNKLHYIEQSFDSSAVLRIFTNSNQISIDGVETANSNACNDILEYINMNTYRHIKTSIKTIKERYIKAPYGFNDDDIEWIVAMLFKNGEVTMCLNNENITVTNRSADDIWRYITKKEYVERILLEKREKVSETQKKAVKQLLQEVFGADNTSTEEDRLMDIFKKRAKDFIYNLADYENKFAIEKRYPGKEVISKIKNVLETIIGTDFPSEFFKLASNRLEDLLDLHDDFEKVKGFFKNEQVNYFDKALKAIDVYNDSQVYINNREIEAKIKEIKEIVNNDNPYSEIYRLPDLLDTFNHLYGALLDSYMEPVLQDIEEARTRVFEELDKTEIKSEYWTSKIHEAFKRSSDKARSSTNIAILNSMKVEVSALKDRLLNEISAAQAKYLAEKATENTAGDTSIPVVPQKRTRTVSLKTVTAGQSWALETEADVDKMVADIKAKVMRELSDKEIIKVEV